jgi:hypothetical protein
VIFASIGPQLDTRARTDAQPVSITSTTPIITPRKARFHIPIPRS